MCAFVSVYGDNILLKNNKFSNNSEAIAQIGIEIGLNTNKPSKNITIVNNVIENSTSKSKGNKGPSFEGDVSNILISNNTIKGFSQAITTSFSKKSNVEKLST